MQLPRHRRRSSPRRHAARPRTLQRALLRPVTLLLVVVAVAGVAGWQWGRSGDSLPPDVGVVVAHVDGDTADVRINGKVERVRFIGIDTPEVYHRDGSPVDCYGPEASARTRELLPLGTEVRLTGDVVGRDDYGRLLAYVYRRDDELFVNAALIADGFARPLRIAPNDTHAAEFAALATSARQAGAGLWTACVG